MQPMTIDELRSVAEVRGINYQIIDDPDPLMIRSRLSKEFPISQENMFDSFADPVAHVGMFPIIVGSTPPIRRGLEGVLPENQFFAFEHVQESNLPPRVMLARYTLNRPNSIIKEAVTDPFGAAGDVEILDKKKGLITLSFEDAGSAKTLFTAESSFQTETGSVFERGFIDRVWLNFFERMMFANGQITDGEYLT